MCDCYVLLIRNMGLTAKKYGVWVSFYPQTSDFWLNHKLTPIDFESNFKKI
jgi:hypothetical protein